MKKIILSIFVLSTFWANAQNPTIDYDKDIKPLNQKIESLKSENGKLKNQITTLFNDLSKTNVALDILRNQTQANSNAINQTSQELGLKITTTETNANQKISAVDESLSKNSLYGIVGVLSAILLSGLLYWLLSKKQKSDKSDFIEQLNKTKSSIEESLVKEFGKQTELMESQLLLIEQQKTTLQATPNAEPDHSLALKVCGQINVMENNLMRMDQNVKGIKHIKRSIGNLKDNLIANGYEMPELLGKQFHQGMKAIKTATIQDESLEKDSEVITKVLIPQVNYNDKMIQTAQIEVSVG